MICNKRNAAPYIRNDLVRRSWCCVAVQPISANEKGRKVKFSELAERPILKTQAEGQFDNPRGAGKPLNVEGDGSADAIGFRIMADAGVVPREIQLVLSRFGAAPLIA